MRRIYNYRQTLISLLRRQLLPKGEASTLHGPRGSCRAKSASREARGPRTSFSLQGEGVMRSMTDEVLYLALF
jgi:hypothetical protein